MMGGGKGLKGVTRDSGGKFSEVCETRILFAIAKYARESVNENKSVYC